MIRYDIADGVATVTLDRPERRNAITIALLDALLAALEQALTNDAVHVILLQAEGRDFCVGDDFDELLAPDRPQGPDFVDALQNVTRLLMLGGKPVVCAAQGHMVGGAAAWPLNADHLIVADDARFLTPEARYGLYFSGGMSLLLTERIGTARAAPVLAGYGVLDAATLVSIGLAMQSVSTEHLHSVARDYAVGLAAQPGQTLAALKVAQSTALAPQLEAALADETRRCNEAAANPGVFAAIRDWYEGRRQRG